MVAGCVISQQGPSRGTHHAWSEVGWGCRVLFANVYLIWSHSFWNTAMSLPLVSLLSGLNRHVWPSIFRGLYQLLFSLL